MPSITINGITFDPLATAAVNPAAASVNAVMADVEAAPSNYVLVQTREPLARDDKQKLQQTGVTIQEYVPEDTYLCRCDPSNLGALRALPFVAWVGRYDADLKVAPSALGLTARPAGYNLLEIKARPVAVLDATPMTVDIVLQPGVDASEARGKIAEAAGVTPESIQVGQNKLRLSIKARRLREVAAVEEVHHIEPVQPVKLHNEIARQILGVPPPTGQAITVEGEGQIVAVADTGFDNGSTTPAHPAFQGRVLKLYALGRNNRADDPHGHGTHVAGSVLADGTSATEGVIQGTAPKAKLVLQSLLDSDNHLGGLPADLHDLFIDPYQNEGARIHTNSWGNTVGDSSYNANASEVDDFVWNHRDCLILFAAGNEGTDQNANGIIDPSSLTPPGTAKNCLTVGATENQRPTFNLTYKAGFGYPANPIASDFVADNPDGMAAFSSRGPTADRRFKPDVVAPGTAVLSTRSTKTASRGWQLSADPLYFYDGGTSMSTPLVAGCAALLREVLLRERHVNTPSAALMKALLVNGAQEIAGQYVPTETGPIPNNNCGFGRVDVTETAGALADDGDAMFWDEAKALDTGEEETRDFKLATTGRTLKVTLVWTDYKGAHLQNDLDLIVRAPDGTERHGNVLAGSNAFDRVNNVEQVVWTAAPAGTFQITVRAFRITQATQTYALVVRSMP